MTTDAVTPAPAELTAFAMFVSTVEFVSPAATLTLTFVAFPSTVIENVKVPAPVAVEILVPDWVSSFDTSVSLFASWETNTECVPAVAVGCAVAVTTELSEEVAVCTASGDSVPTCDKLFACVCRLESVLFRVW